MKPKKAKKLEFKKVTLVELKQKEQEAVRGGGSWRYTNCISLCICPY